jgi:hypothetical protein
MFCVFLWEQVLQFLPDCENFARRARYSLLLLGQFVSKLFLADNFYSDAVDRVLELSALRYYR